MRKPKIWEEETQQPSEHLVGLGLIFPQPKTSCGQNEEIGLGQKKHISKEKKNTGSLFLVDKSTGLSSARDKVCDTCTASVVECGSSLLVSDWASTVALSFDGAGISSLLVQTKSLELANSFSCN